MTQSPTPTPTHMTPGDATAVVTRQTAQTISDQLFEIADEFTSDLIRSGADPQVAGSVVANMMLRAAWAVAGGGKIMAGKGEPDPEIFAAAALDATSSVTFSVPSEIVTARAGGAA